MRKKEKPQKNSLNRKEKELLASFEKGEWIAVKNSKKEIKLAQKSATKTLSKDVRINIRLSRPD